MNEWIKYSLFQDACRTFLIQAHSLVPILRWIFLQKLCEGVYLWGAQPATATQVYAVDVESKCETHTAAVTTNTHIPPPHAYTSCTHPTPSSCSITTSPIPISHPTALHPAPLNRWPLSSLISWQSTLITNPPKHTYTCSMRAHTHTLVNPLSLHCISLSPKRRERKDFVVFHLKWNDSSIWILWDYLF